MATADRDVPMTDDHYSSSPDLSLPSRSPSEPGSPSRQDQNQSTFGHNDEIVVGASSALPFATVQDQNSTQALPSESVRLTKEGVPRKKPGRKPGPIVKKAGDGGSPSLIAATPAGSSAEAAKPRRVRKPKDPNAPPVSRKRKAPLQDAAGTDALGPSTATTASGFQRSSSANRHFEPKVELTSMRMDIDSRSTPPSTIPITSFPSLHPQPRQPPLAIMAMASRPDPFKGILNAEDSPPRPTPAVPAASTTPVRSVGQSYDPIRSSTYDPVRDNVLAYGTGSPRAPSQVTNRASASPSIASLVDPPPLPHARSPGVASSITHQVSPPSLSSQLHMHPYHNSNGNNSSGSNHNPFLPPSPSPSNVVRHPAPSSVSSARPQASAGKSAAGAALKTAASSAKTAPNTPSPSVPSKTSSQTKSTASSGTKASASAKSGGDSTAASKPNSRTNPTASTAAGAKSAASKPASSKPATSKPATKTAASKASAAKTAAAAAAAAAAADASSAAPSPTSGSASSRDVTMTGTDTPPPAGFNAPLIKKFSSILQQERGAKPNKAAASATSSPKLSGTKDDGALAVLGTPALSPLPNGGEQERSILDFGKAQPGEQTSAPSIVLHIPLIRGENNKYVNFMRMAEERYGWDALHPRLAAHRDRKLRIAAAASALEKNGSGRESGEEMTDDMQSGDEGSNDEGGAAGDNGATGVNASGPDDAPAKPIRKKRIFKEDEYDKDDDFVDDSEMLWEEQAAASRDGFFVYSGPLVPEEEKPAEGSTPTTKRGRGTRTARGGTSKAATTKTAASRTTAGTGARGGTAARKPRVTKQEKEQREREKAESEKALSKAVPGTSPAFLSGITIDV